MRTLREQFFKLPTKIKRKFKLTISRYIAFRHLRSKHAFGFISFTTLLSIFGLMLGVASLNIISSFSSGFSDKIQKKLSDIDGHIRIKKYVHSQDPFMSWQEYLTIRDSLQTLPETCTAIPYVEKRAMVRKKNSTEGILLYGVPDSSLISVFHLDEFIIDGALHFTEGDQLILGSRLADELGLQLNSSVIIFDLEKTILENSLSARKFVVTGIIETGFSEYDKIIAFIPLAAAREFFIPDSGVTGIIANFQHPDRIAEIDKQILGKIGSYPYITSTWLERHATLFGWLNIYDLPIKLVMIFITLVAIFNISSTLWMIISEKTRDIGILKTMGFSQGQIKDIFLTEGFIIGLAGAVLGLAGSVIFLVLQVKFKFISLSSDVYFLDYLPVHWSVENIALYPTLALLLSLTASYIPCLKTKKIRPSEAVRYE